MDGQHGSYYSPTTHTHSYLPLSGGTITGDVGIGTTGPDGVLHISSGNANSDCRLIIEADEDNNDENATPQIWLKADGDITEGLIGLNNNYLDFVNNVGSTLKGFRFYLGNTSNSGTTDPYTGATESLRIDSSGNVGINNSSPSYKLDVNGTFRATGSSVFDGDVTFNNDAGVMAYANNRSTSIPNASWTVIQFNDENDTDDNKGWDLKGNYSTSTYRFTAPRTGIYGYRYGFYIQSTSAGSFTFATNTAVNGSIRLNGSEYLYNTRGWTPGNGASMQPWCFQTGLIAMTSGQYAEVVCYQNTGATRKTRSTNIPYNFVEYWWHGRHA